MDPEGGRRERRREKRVRGRYERGVGTEQVVGSREEGEISGAIAFFIVTLGPLPWL